ncbi:MAG: hypothetical protein ACD_47C00335G0002 [uncultured bacterium]|nr:MAG: hypothetical protein ACD_47C00335G0002 [uncultured bacterium]
MPVSTLVIITISGLAASITLKKSKSENEFFMLTAHIIKSLRRAKLYVKTILKTL